MNGLNGFDPTMLGGSYGFDDANTLQGLGRGGLDGANSMAGLPVEDYSPLYMTDEFRMLYFKVLPCSKRYVHDWTTCPFAHSGEKARRRDPRLYNYTGIACPDMKRTGNCIRGDKCPYAHNVFEYWLHPTRYRTQLCNDGKGCGRRVCFFAHTLEEVRLPKQKPYVSPEAVAAASLEALAEAAGGGEGSGSGGNFSGMGAAEVLGPAAGGSLYKSYSCPDNNGVVQQQQQQYNAALGQMSRAGGGMSGGGGGGMSGGGGGAMTGGPGYGGLGKVDEHEAFSAPLPAASLNAGSLPPMPTISSGASHELSASAGGGDLAGSLAAIKLAVQQGTLPQEALLSLLADLLTPGDKPAAHGSPGQQQQQQQRGAGGSSKDDLSIGIGGGNGGGMSLASGSLPAHSGAPSTSSGSNGGGNSEMLAEAVPRSGGLWHTASLPIGAIDRRSVSIAAAAAGQDWRSLAAASPELAAALANAAASGGVGNVSGPSASGAMTMDDSMAMSQAMAAAAVAHNSGGGQSGGQQSDPVAQVLQQSAATQSSAAANGQASQEAKLAKAKSLTTWLNKLKRGGNSESVAAAVNSGVTAPELEQLQQQFQSMSHADAADADPPPSS